MRQIFLSFSFSHLDADREFVEAIEGLLESHDIAVVTGRRLGGDGLTPQIQRRISDCDGLIALLTRRDALASGGFITHPWVRDELNYARGLGRRAIALLESEVKDGGMYGANEYIAFDRAALLPPFIALAETIGQWQSEYGRELRVLLLPEEAARLVALGDGWRVEYRSGPPGAIDDSWRVAQAVVEPGGTYARLAGIREQALLQLRVRRDGTVAWRSPITSQYMQIQMQKNAGGGA